MTEWLAVNGGDVALELLVLARPSVDRELGIEYLPFRTTGAFAGLAESGKFESVRIVNGRGSDLGVYRSSWVLLSRDKSIKQLADQDAGSAEERPEPLLWTDARTDLIAVLIYEDLFANLWKMFGSSQSGNVSE